MKTESYSDSKERQEKTKSLVERILELHKTSPRTPGDKERVARVPERSSGIEKIDSTDRQIDRLVYELSPTGMIYGLSPEEIAIVEGRE